MQITFLGTSTGVPMAGRRCSCTMVEVDLAICKAAHFAATDYAPVLAESKIRRVCVNHYSAWNMANIQKLSQDSQQLNVTVVTDGMEIRI